MKPRLVLLIALAVSLVVIAGCGGKGGSVSSLWSDVPELPGSKEADFSLPLPIRLIMQTAVKASASGNDVDLDKFDFLGYTTAQSPQEIADFYSADRMSEAGWNLSDQPGCISGSDGQSLGGGGFCIFGRDDGAKQSVLFIATAQEEGKDDTQVYYVRFEGQLKGQ